MPVNSSFADPSGVARQISLLRGQQGAGQGASAQNLTAVQRLQELKGSDLSLQDNVRAAVKHISGSIQTAADVVTETDADSGLEKGIRTVSYRIPSAVEVVNSAKQNIPSNFTLTDPIVSGDQTIVDVAGGQYSIDIESLRQIDSEADSYIREEDVVDGRVQFGSYEELKGFFSSITDYILTPAIEAEESPEKKQLAERFVDAATQVENAFSTLVSTVLTEVFGVEANATEVDLSSELTNLAKAESEEYVVALDRENRALITQYLEDLGMENQVIEFQNAEGNSEQLTLSKYVEQKGVTDDLLTQLREKVSQHADDFRSSGDDTKVQVASQLDSVLSQYSEGLQAQLKDIVSRSALEGVSLTPATANQEQVDALIQFSQNLGDALNLEVVPQAAK